MDNQISNKIDELEELIELAEKVSINIDMTNDKVERLSQYAIIFFFSSVFLLASILKFQEIHKVDFRNIYDFLAPAFFFIGILAFASILIKLLNSVTKMRKEIKNETLILEDLLNMIHSYKQIAYNDISIVKKAVIDMRLSRIKFNKKENPSISFSKEKKVVTAS